MRLLCRCTAGLKEWSSSHWKIHWQCHMLEGRGSAVGTSLRAWLPLSSVPDIRVRSWYSTCRLKGFFEGWLGFFHFPGPNNYCSCFTAHSIFNRSRLFKVLGIVKVVSPCSEMGRGYLRRIIELNVMLFECSATRYWQNGVKYLPTHYSIYGENVEHF